MSKTDRNSTKKPEPVTSTVSAKPEVENYSDMMRAFTKWKIITYIWVVFLPPYALYRIWGKKTEFRRSEKVVWTMVIVVYLVYFAYLTATGA